MPAPTTVRSVRSRVAESVGRLRAVGDPERAQRQRRYFKVYERVRFFGVAAPDVRRIGPEIFGEVRKIWTVDDAVAYCDALVRRPELEAKVLGLLVLARFERSFRTQLLGTVKQWLLRDFLATWAAVDAVSPWVIAPLIGRYPDLGYAVKGWTRSRSLWVRRAALVSFIRSPDAVSGWTTRMTLPRRFSATRTISSTRRPVGCSARQERRIWLASNGCCGGTARGFRVQRFATR